MKKSKILAIAMATTIIASSSINAFAVTQNYTKSDVKILLQQGDICGSIFDEEYSKKLLYAKVFAQVIIDNENVSQELINKAYIDLKELLDNPVTVGWLAAPYLMGDVDMDDEVNILDVTLTQQYLAKYENIENFWSMDSNQDGYININDATNIQKYIIGFETDSIVGTYTPEYYYLKN